MKIDKGSIVLYSLKQIHQSESTRSSFTKNDLSNALGISEGTLDLYLTKLHSKGSIKRVKKKYITDLRTLAPITENGMRDAERIEAVVSDLMLTEDMHHVPSCIPLNRVLRRIPDPLERSFFANLCSQNLSFDLPLYLDALNLSKQDIRLSNLVSRNKEREGASDPRSFIELLYKASTIKKIDVDSFSEMDLSSKDIDALIILAEAKMRGGKIQEARSIHDYLLTVRTDLTNSQWFMIKVDQARALEKEGRLDEAINILENLSKNLDNKLFLAYLRVFLARYYYLKGDAQTSAAIFKSTIGAMQNFGMPLFLSTAYNNLGVFHFVSGKDDEAEKDWRVARRLARKCKSEFMEAIVLPNLADIEMKKGNLDLAEKHLSRAFKIFKGRGDGEGISIIEYNYALLELEKNDLGRALEHYRATYTIAPPYPPLQIRPALESEFISRGLAKGFSDIKERLLAD